MMKAILVCLLVGVCGPAYGPTSARLQQQVVRIERREYADEVDEKVESRIETQLKLDDPQWSVTILKHSSQGGRRLLELQRGTPRVTVGIVYLKTEGEAAKDIQFRLHTIQMPTFKKLEELGDEGYTMTETGPLLFRVRMIVVQIESSDRSIVTQHNVAQRVIASVRTTDQNRP
jgi:hypothetical protein